MSDVAALWLPIVVSAILVFLASSIIHMLSPWHKSDYPKLQNEEAVLEALRPLAIPPGDYMMPRPSSRAEMRTPEFAERMKRGPVVVFTVMPSGGTSMARSLGLWFLYCLVVSAFAALVAGRMVPPHGASHQGIFKLVSVVAFVGYSLALWQLSIWYSRAWSTTIKATVDGLIYALLTGAAFTHLWHLWR